MASKGSKQLYFEINNSCPHSIYKETSPSISRQPCIKKVCNSDNKRHDGHGLSVERKENIRDTTSTQSGFSMSNVFSKEIRWRSTSHLRPQRSQLICVSEALPANFTNRCSQFRTDKRLVSENRHSPGLFSFTNRRTTQEVPPCNLQQRSAAIDCLTVWPVIGSKDVCHGNKLDCGNPTSTRLPCNRVSGRFPPGQSGSCSTGFSGCGNFENIGDLRLAHKSSQVCSGTLSGGRVSWSTMEHSAELGKTSIQKDNKDKINHFQNVEQWKQFAARSSEFIRFAELCKLCSIRRSTTLSKNATVSKIIQSEQAKAKNKSSSAGSARLKMVVRGHRKQLNTNSPEKCDSLLDYRCSRLRVGSPIEQHLPIRKVGSIPKTLAFKFKRNVCRICSHKQSADDSTECSHTYTVRQQDSCGTPQKRGGDTFPDTSKVDNQAPKTCRAVTFNSLSHLPPGESKRNCGSPIKGSQSTRVASSTPSRGGYIQSVGRPRYRSVRVKRNGYRTKVRNVGFQRQLRSFLRRFQPTVGLSAGLGISPTQLNTKSTNSFEQCQRNVHSNSTKMDQMLLATRPASESHSRASSDREPAEGLNRSDNRQISCTGGQVDPTCLENWGWADQVAHWTVEEQNLLKSSWRTSTLTTYNAPIKRWLSWCNINKINPKAPEGVQVARFLTKLYLEDKLAYKTILLHKSAVSTYCATSEIDITKHFFIQQVLKAISLAQPAVRKAPIWDTAILFNWLKTSTNSGSLFEISRRTALVLLLASGRRIHDLTLLENSPENLIFTEDEISLWPKFGSKTDSKTHRQSGWLLRKHPDHRVCPVRHINNLIETSQSRRSADTTVTSLFISVLGKLKPASRTMIAGWIRSIFKDANLDAPPGSIRSAVASRSWLENRPVQEILDRGNWKSIKTFQKFYCRPVNKMNEASSNGDLLQLNFSSIK